MGTLCSRRAPGDAASQADGTGELEKLMLQHRRKGNEHFKKQEYKSAVEEYTQALKIQPKEAPLWVNRSIASRQLKRWDDAVHDASRAVELQPSNEKAHYGKAFALKNLDRIAEAKKACEAGLAVQADNVQLKELAEALKACPEKPLAAVAAKAKADSKKVEAKKEPKKKVYSVDYSRFKDIGSDSEDDAPILDPVTEIGGTQAEEPQMGLSKNPTMEERTYVIDQMMEMIRNARKNAQEEMRSESGGRDFAETYLSSGPKVVGSMPDDYRKAVGTITLDSLAKFNSKNKRMLISVYGDIYDISNRSEMYGPNTKKSSWAGKDLTWALITGHEDVDHFNKLYDIFKLDHAKLERFLRVVCHWLVSYTDDHGKPVGRLQEWENERDLPEPPAEDIKDPCPTQ